jgi:hypothetical protein
MIYTLGCSHTKFYWPTWADWLQVYEQQPVTNWAYMGYGHSNFYWTLLDNLDSLTADDQVVVMWSQNHRITQWYDQSWVEEKDIAGFFPDTDGKIWYTQDRPYTGMFRVHPDFMPSLSHMIVDLFQTILHTQMLLNTIGCKYQMLFNQNPWLDCRPTFQPAFKLNFAHRLEINHSEREHALQLLELKPVQNLLNLIDWTRFPDAPSNVFDPASYQGIYEYGKQKKYLIYAHDTDPHTTCLAHHDYVVEKILKCKSQHKDTAKEISKTAMTMFIPEFTDQDRLGDVDKIMLNNNFKIMLDQLK